MAAIGMMGAEYTIHNISSGGVALEQNPYRRYLAVFSDSDVTIEFYTGSSKTGEFILPAGIPWSPLTSPTNRLIIRGDSGILMEA